jgi:hypothetical protein
MDATCEEIRMGAGVDVIFIYIYIYVNISWILTCAIRVYPNGVFRNRAEDNTCRIRSYLFTYKGRLTQL